MKILIATDSPLVNTGYASVARITGRELKKRKYDVYFTHFNAYDKSGQLYDYENMVVLPNSALHRDPDGIYGDAQAISELHNKYKFDVIIWLNDSYRYRYLLDLSQDIRNRSVFWMPFEGMIPDYGGAEIINAFKSVRFVTKYALDINSKVINNPDVGFIHHGIDLDIFKPCTSKETKKANRKIPDGRQIFKNKFIVMRNDRNQPRKRWDKTLEYFAEFAKDKQDVLLYCKCDPQDGVSPYKLDEMAAELKLHGKIHFDKNFYSESELVDKTYDIANVTLSTTGGEGFGLLSAESLACGVPHIITSVAASPEVIGDCGHLIDIETVERYEPLQTDHAIPSKQAILDALESYYKDWKYDGSKKALEMGSRARKRAEELFSFNYVYDQWDDLIKTVAYDANLISIITPVHNELEMTKKFYESVTDFTDCNYEIIFIDNGSSDGTADWLEQISASNPRVRFITNKENLGFGKASNQGLDQAKGHYVAFVNNDCEVTGRSENGECWLTMLVDALQLSPDAGIVGPMIARRDDVMSGFNCHYGFCVMLPKSVLDHIGGFDENFQMAYYEDADLSIRVQSAGYKIVTLGEDENGKSVFPLNHFSGQTNKNLDLSKEIKHNIEYLNQKWGKGARSKIKVLFHTFIGKGTGFSTIAEGLIPELHELGFDVYVHDWDNGRNIEDPLISQLYEKTRTKSIRLLIDQSINIVCHLMESFEHIKARYKVGISLAESTKMRPSYVDACNGMDRIITFSEFNKLVQQNSKIEKPIHVIRPGINPKFSFKEREVKEEFTILNVGVCQNRKRTIDAVRAFVETFPKSEYPNVKLIIRSSAFGILDWIEPYTHRANIIPVYTEENKMLSTDDMVKMYHDADMLIHTSSGEGIGYAILEGMATGLPVAYTKWSTPAEFFADPSETIGYPIKVSGMSQAYTEAPDYVEGDSGDWAMADIDHLKAIMLDAYNDRQKSLEVGRESSEFVHKHLTWKESALELWPVLFGMEEERKNKKWIIDFHPDIYKSPKIKTIDSSSRVTIDISTRDRHDYLAALLESLRNQTFKNWDLVLTIDDKDESILQNHLITRLMNIISNSGHGSLLSRGKQKGPHISHQQVLENTNNDLICRVDDDLILEPNFLEKLFNIFLRKDGDNIAAVGGVYLDPSKPANEQFAPETYMDIPEFQGKIDPCTMNLQIFQHGDNLLKSVEHLYSSFMYRTDIARSVGGYYKMFSKIGHREETDFSYRLHLAGFRMVVNPEAMGWHFFAPSGGIRSDGFYNQYNAHSDNMLFEQRKTFWENDLISEENIELKDRIDSSKLYA